MDTKKKTPSGSPEYHMVCPDFEIHAGGIDLSGAPDWLEHISQMIDGQLVHLHKTMDTPSIATGVAHNAGDLIWLEIEPNEEKVCHTWVQFSGLGDYQSFGISEYKLPQLAMLSLAIAEAGY